MADESEGPASSQLGDFGAKGWYEVALARGSNINECHCFLKEWVECQRSGSIKSVWDCVTIQHPEITDTYNLQEAFTVASTSSDARKGAVIAPLNMPLRVIRNNMAIWFLLQNNKQTGEITKPKKDAFELLMRPKTVNLSKRDVRHSKQKLYNDVLDLFGKKVSLHSVKKFQNLIQAVTDCLWEIDGNSQKFANASLNGHCPSLPSHFENIYGATYRDWQTQKKAKPKLKSEALLHQSGNLFEMLSFLESSREYEIDKNFFDASRSLADCLHRYGEYLRKTNEQMAQSSEKIDDFFNENITNPINAVRKDKLDDKYLKLDNMLEQVELYKPIYIDLFDHNVPEDRRRRYDWFQSLKLCHRIQMYKYNCGGGYGNMTFIWKTEDIVNHNLTTAAIDKVRKMVPHFETAAMAKEMRTKYTNIGLKPAVRRSLVHFLTGKIPSGKSGVDDLFEIYTSMPLDEEGEINFLYDERNTNQGRPSGNFQEFYNELDRLLEEYGKAAEERRKSLTAHLPLAVSIADLIRQVKERLKFDENTSIPIPSETTLRYQFMPPFENRNSVTKYKGRFDVVSKIQRRQIRKYHKDAHYVNSYFINLKNWCVINRESCVLICMDDKAKIPIGEPGTPEASTSHNRRTLTKSLITLEASDHNYHLANLTPSVDFFVQIPDDPSSSFFTGPSMSVSRTLYSRVPILLDTLWNCLLLCADN